MAKFICILSVLFLCSCGVSHHMGNINLKPEIVSQMTAGKTTKQDVLTLLGPPQSRSTQKFSAIPTDPATKLPPQLLATETWIYWSHNMEGSTVMLPFYAQTNTKSNTCTASVFFDKDGIVIDYSVIENSF